MTIIEGIGDEIILFLAITVITAVIVCIFIFPSQRMLHSVDLPSTPDESLLHPSIGLAEQNNATPNESSSQTVEIRNENASNSNNQYSYVTHISSMMDHESTVSNRATDSVQDLKLPDHSESQTEDHSINNPEFLRKHRLKFFGEQMTSQNNERITNGLMNNSCDAADEGTSVLSQHSEIASNSNNVDEQISSPSTEGSIRIRLKYLNDTERLVHSKLDDKIGDFKRAHFLEDITNNKIIRLIYNGQLLRGEDRTLESFGIMNNSVIHVQISQNQQPQGPNTTDDSDLDLSHLMWPLFGIILGVLWMLHFQYREYFNIASTVALVGITGLFLMAVWSQSNFQRVATLRPGDTQQHRN